MEGVQIMCASLCVHNCEMYGPCGLAYTPIHAFQDALNKNAMAVPAPNIELGYAALKMKKLHFITINSGTYIDLISAGDRPSKPTVTGGVTTGSATEATVGDAGTITTAPKIEPFKVQEIILVHARSTDINNMARNQYIIQKHNLQQCL